MDTLKAIVSIILSKKKISHLEVLNKNFFNSARETKFTELYNCIEEGIEYDKTLVGLNKSKFSDDDASLKLYGEKQSISYRQLKKRFYYRILNTLFFLNVNQLETKNVLDDMYFNCSRTLMQAKILRLFGSTEPGVAIIKHRYIDAKKYEFYDILAEYSSFLLQFYAQKGKIKELEAEKTNFFLYKKLADSENATKVIYFTQTVMFNNTGSVSKKALEYLEIGIAEIEKLIQDNFTVINYYYLQQLKLIFLDAKYNVEDLWKESDEALSIFKNYNFFTDYKKIGLVKLSKMAACLYLMKFDEGLCLYYDSCKIYAIGTSRNWHLVEMWGALIATHMGNREVAYKIYDNVYKNIKNRELKDYEEFWSFYEAYCHIYMKIYNESDKIEIVSLKKKFSIAAFDNDLKSFAKDNSGYKASLNILKFIFALFDKGKVIDGEQVKNRMKEEKEAKNLSIAKSLKTYRNRYLTEPNNQRAYTFYSMLITLSDFDVYFNVRKAAKKCSEDIMTLAKHSYRPLTKEPVDILNSTSNDESKNAPIEKWKIHEWEIIPFEKLWTFILKILEYNARPDVKKNSIYISDEELRFLIGEDIPIY